MKRLFIFDMDGTLIPKSTGVLEIARLTGHLPQLTELERGLSDKTIDGLSFTSACIELWRDLTPEVVRLAFDQSPKLKNIRIVLKTIKKMKSTSCLITAAPHFYAELFKEYGFDYIFSSKPYDLNDRKFVAENILYGKDKPLIAEKLCRGIGFEFKEAVAFGDSMSDIQLFDSLTHTVAVNGDHHIASTAKYSYEGSDLLEAFSLLDFVTR